MDTRSFTNAAEFLAAAEPLLSASEARNNLLYGIGAFLVYALTWLGVIFAFGLVTGTHPGT